MANQCAPGEDCSCSDLIMYALLFHGLKSVRPPFTHGKLRVKRNALLPLCFISFPFVILHIFMFSLAFSVALQPFESISLMFAVLYRFWSKQSSERSRF